MGIPILGDLIDDVIGSVKDVVSEVVVDKDKRDQINYDLEVLKDRANERAHAEMIAQTEVNKVEASNGNMFVAGWRPFVGWVGGIGLATQAIIMPLISYLVDRPLPAFDTELLILTLGGMLGIGGMRTYEKVKGVSTNDYRDRPAPKKEEPVIEYISEPVIQPLPEDAPWSK